MYSYRDRDSYRYSYSLICYRLLSKSSICLICLRLPVAGLAGVAWLLDGLGALLG